MVDPRIANNMRQLTWWFSASVTGLIVVAFFLAPVTSSERVLVWLGVAVWLVAGVMFYVVLGLLASRMNRSVLTWVGASVIFAPVGPFIAYFAMRRLVKHGGGA